MWKSIYRPSPEVPELVIEPSHRRSLTASLDAYLNADHRLIISALSLSQPCSSTKSILGVQILTLCVAALGQLPSCFCDNFWLCLHKLPCRFVLFKALLEFSSTRFFCSWAASASSRHRRQASKPQVQCIVQQVRPSSQLPSLSFPFQVSTPSPVMQSTVVNFCASKKEDLGFAFSRMGK